MNPTRTLAAALLLLASPSAWAFFDNYLPLTKDERSHRFPQHSLYSGDACEPGERTVAELGPRGVRFARREGVLTLGGEDRGGKPFRVTLGLPPHSCALYRADLDADGTQDLVLTFATGGNGMAPSSHVITVLFDAQGRPVPWEADGYFAHDEHGVVDLLDLDGDKKAELVRQGFGEGYWLTSLYEAEGGRWRRVRGAHAGRGWPLATRFTRKPNRQVVTPPKQGRSPFEADLGNTEAPGAKPVRLAGAELRESEDPRLKLQDGRTCTPSSWHATMAVVVDRPGGRDAALLGAPRETRALLDEVTKRGLPVTFTGQRSRGTCSPEGVFAREGTASP